VAFLVRPPGGPGGSPLEPGGALHSAVPHYDARKALRDPNPLPRPVAPRLPPVGLDVERGDRVYSAMAVSRPIAPRLG
jgi:hypothetical protein